MKIIYSRKQITVIKTSKSATSSVEIPEIVLLTDEEIDNAKTLMIWNHLWKNDWQLHKICQRDWWYKIPASGKDAYNKQVDPAIQSMETARKTFNDTLSAAGLWWYSCSWTVCSQTPTTIENVILPKSSWSALSINCTHCSSSANNQ